jgi:hypothetical protein
MSRSYHVKYGVEEKEVMECLVDYLCGEDNEGEEIPNQTKTGNKGEEDSFHHESECSQPRICGQGVLKIKISLMPVRVLTPESSPM